MTTGKGRAEQTGLLCVHITHEIFKCVHLSYDKLYSQKLTWTPGPLCGSPAERFHLHSNEPGIIEGSNGSATPTIQQRIYMYGYKVQTKTVSSGAEAF